MHEMYIDDDGYTCFVDETVPGPGIFWTLHHDGWNAFPNLPDAAEPLLVTGDHTLPGVNDHSQAREAYAYWLRGDGVDYDEPVIRVEVEYDTEFTGGDYDKVGQVVTVHIKPSTWMETDETASVHDAFREATGMSPIHLIHWQILEDEGEVDDFLAEPGEEPAENEDPTPTFHTIRITIKGGCFQDIEIPDALIAPGMAWDLEIVDMDVLEEEEE